MEIIDASSGDISGCEHYTVDAIAEMSGKLMSDGMHQVEADMEAIRLLSREVLRGIQMGMFE